MTVRGAGDVHLADRVTGTRSPWKDRRADSVSTPFAFSRSAHAPVITLSWMTREVGSSTVLQGVSAVRPAWIAGGKSPPRPLTGIVFLAFENKHVIAQEDQ